MVSLLVGYSALILRVFVGFIFFMSGFRKVKDFKGSVKFVKKTLKLKPAGLWAFLLAYTEFIAGFALIVGFATRISVVLLAVVIIVAFLYNAFVWKKTFSGYQLDLLILVCLIALFLLGAGEFSVDQVIGWVLG